MMFYNGMVQFRLLFLLGVALAVFLIGVFFLLSASLGDGKSTIEINDLTPNGPELSNGDWFGSSVVNLGDIDGDGIPEIAVGAEYDDAGGINQGALHIIFLNPNGTPKSTIEINGLTPNGPELSNWDRFGSSVANLGDMDGDGTVDIAVGSYGDGYRKGALHIIFLNPNGTPKSTIEINGLTPNGPDLSNADHFGWSVANLGDMDGDGTTDIAVGADSDDAGGTNKGALHIIFLNPNGTPKSTIEINGLTPNGPDLSDYTFFGLSVANLGDMDGDGVIDIAVGAGSERYRAIKGALHIIFLNPNGTPKSTIEINGLTPNGPDLSNGDYFGSSVANLGDMDGDGTTDIAAGANSYDAGSTGKGALHIIFLNSDGTPKSTVTINDMTTNGPVLSSNDGFGSSVANLGDLDGDGTIDIAVGAYLNDAGGVSKGALHIVFLDGVTMQSLQLP